MPRGAGKEAGHLKLGRSRARRMDGAQPRHQGDVRHLRLRPRGGVVELLSGGTVQVIPNGGAGGPQRCDGEAAATDVPHRQPRPAVLARPHAGARRICQGEADDGGFGNGGSAATNGTAGAGGGGGWYGGCSAGSGTSLSAGSRSAGHAGAVISRDHGVLASLGMTVGPFRAAAIADAAPNSTSCRAPRPSRARSARRHVPAWRPAPVACVLRAKASMRKLLCPALRTRKGPKPAARGAPLGSR
jgi:hypothetical protein